MTQSKATPTAPETSTTPRDQAPPHDDGPLESIGKAITAPIRDDPDEDPDLKPAERDDAERPPTP